MSFFDTMLEDVETMAIIGHIRPDETVSDPVWQRTTTWKNIILMSE